MALRFQKKDDVDRAAKEERQTGATVVVLVLAAVIFGAVDWFSGGSLASYEQELAVLIGVFFVGWLVEPFYYEFRIRTKEIDGKVSGIEATVNGSKERHAELLERLTAIEEKLTEIQDARRI